MEKDYYYKGQGRSWVEIGNYTLSLTGPSSALLSCVTLGVTSGLPICVFLYKRERG